MKKILQKTSKLWRKISNIFITHPHLPIGPESKKLLESVLECEEKLRHLPSPLRSVVATPTITKHETCGSRITYCDNNQLCRVEGTSWAHATTVATIWYNKLSTVALLLLKRVSKLHMTPRGKHISYVTGAYCKYIVVLSRR